MILSKLFFPILLGLVISQELEKIETKECRERERLISSEKEDLYALVDAVEDQRLVLRCRFCNEEATDQPKNWYMVREFGTEPREVVPDTDNDIKLIRISVNQKRSLIIENFTQEDTGFYYCVHFEDKSNTEKFNFLVDLVSQDNVSTIEKGDIGDWANYYDDYFAPVNNMFKSSIAPEFNKVRDHFKLSMELVTQWGPFGKCEVCGRPQGNGIMRKKGSCRIKLTPFPSSFENYSPEELYLRKAPAISCRSKRFAKLLPQISNITKVIPDFVQQEKCDGVCNPDAEGINTGWKVGKGKGFKYRRHFVIPENSGMTLMCPESNLDNNVIWKKNGKVIKKGETSYPHVIADTFGSLYLIEVSSADKGNYTCEVDGIRMQQVVIFIASKSSLLTGELLRYMVYLSFILFLSSFCYCAGLIITCQRRHTFKTYKDLKEEEPRRKNQEIDSLL